MAAHTTATTAWKWNKVDVAGKKICCIGAGYVGGPTMAIIAKNVPSMTVRRVPRRESALFPQPHTFTAGYRGGHLTAPH